MGFDLPWLFTWFAKKRKVIFEVHVIESRRHSNIAGLYNNAIECIHYLKKLKQCFKEGSLEIVLSNLKTLNDRQYSDELRAIYGGGPFSLSGKYAQFKVDSAKWHSWSSDRKLQHIQFFHNFRPKLSDSFDKPAKAGRKPHQVFRNRNQTEMVIDRFEKTNK